MDYYIERTHDGDIYLNENGYDEPKEAFKTISQLALDSGSLHEEALVCDFGCATGEFIYHLSRQFPGARYYGYDILPELIDEAKIRAPELEFHIGSVLDKELLPANSIDVATFIGVHAMYDDVESWLANLLYWTRDGGSIYVFGPFNSHPVDVWLTCRKADDPDPKHREIGWNILSKASVAKYLDTTKAKGKYRYIPFEMPFDISPRPEDPFRSWTILDNDGHRMLTNGLCLLLPIEILEIRL